jgi:lipoxygenase homology domain-containing protein 1
LSGAGTDANVILTIFGENGDSGELELKKSETHMNKFERNQTDVFTLKGILSVGELVKLRVWHDNTGRLLGNTSWHLEFVKVEDLTTRREYVFPCNKWLSLSKDDKQIVRDLKPVGDRIDEPKPGEKTTYEITVFTADERDAGTKHNAAIVLIGEEGSTKEKLLESTSERTVLRRGQEDTFIFKTGSVGSLKKIYLSHLTGLGYSSMRGSESDIWKCSHVVIKDMSTGVLYLFNVKDAIYLNQRPKSYRLESKKEGLIAKTKSLKNIDYEVAVVTADERDAGTGIQKANFKIVDTIL